MNAGNQRPRVMKLKEQLKKKIGVSHFPRLPRLALVKAFKQLLYSSRSQFNALCKDSKGFQEGIPQRLVTPVFQPKKSRERETTLTPQVWNGVLRSRRDFCCPKRLRTHEGRGASGAPVSAKARQQETRKFRVSWLAITVLTNESPLIRFLQC